MWLGVTGCGSLSLIINMAKNRLFSKHPVLKVVLLDNRKYTLQWKY